jgi:hypothetical protein
MGYADGREFSESFRTMMQKVANDMVWSLSLVVDHVHLKEKDGKFVYRDLFRIIPAKELKKKIEDPEEGLALRMSPIKLDGKNHLGLYDPEKHEYLSEFVASLLPDLLVDVNLQVMHAGREYDIRKARERRVREKRADKPPIEHRLKHGCGHCTCRDGCECEKAMKGGVK